MSEYILRVKTQDNILIEGVSVIDNDNKIQMDIDTDHYKIEYDDARIELVKENSDSKFTIKYAENIAIATLEIKGENAYKMDLPVESIAYKFMDREFSLTYKLVSQEMPLQISFTKCKNKC